MWADLWRRREETLRTRFAKQVESLEFKTQSLPPLIVGDICRIQNQHGRFPLRWDRTGMVVECGDHDQYLVKMDGSGRLTTRNRKYLRKIDPFYRRDPKNSSASPSVPSPQAATPPLPCPVAEEAGESMDTAPRAAPADTEEVPATDNSTGHDGCRRSSRIRQPPLWHNDYVVGAFQITSR